jgi:peptide-methionine (S)-S-oxide reductase
MMAMETATFAAGCFWGVESLFSSLPGVVATRVGYTGGLLADPTYQQVCQGDTGHAEAVELQFDPDQHTYAELVALFFNQHDPTTLNRQGPDVGTQYRSAIFTHSVQQVATAQQVLQQQQAKLSQPIVTTIEPAGVFYPAESYHQRYFEKRGIAPTCH